MKKLIANMEHALTQVIYYRKQIDALRFVRTDPFVTGYEEDKYVREQYNAINCELYRKLNDAYARLLTWSSCVGENQRKKATKLALERYINASNSFREKMTHSDGYPHEWDDEKEKKFIQDLKGEFTLQLLKKQAGMPLNKEDIEYLSLMANHQEDTQLTEDVYTNLKKGKS